MSRVLLLMRHAKSDWNNPQLTDKQRSLNPRGRDSAPIMANWLLSNQLMPDLILCSSAVRTQQTLELMMQVWTATAHLSSTISPSEADASEADASELSQPQLSQPLRPLPEISIEDGLYLASESQILSHARSFANIASKQRVMLLGHNPGLECLASKLSQGEVAMPTAAIGILASNTEDLGWPSKWDDPKMWKWRGLVKPREIGT